MATITLSSSANYDICSGQTAAATLDLFTVNNGQLLIDTDTKYCAGHATTSGTSTSNGSLDSVTISPTAVAGELKLDGMNIWMIPYSGGSGTAPVPLPTALVPTAATWTNGQVKLTFGAAHGYVQGDIIGVGGFIGADDPNGYSGEVEVTSVPATTTLTYQILGDNPGTATITDGKVLKKFKVEQTQTWTVSTASISAGVASFTTTAEHILTANNYVTITSVVSTGTGSFNGNWTLSAATFAGTTVTATTSANHNYSVGDTVVVAGVVSTGTGTFNGIYLIETVTANQFTYTNTGTTLVRTSGGTVVKRYKVLATGLGATTFQVANPSTATYTSGGTITKVALAVWQGQWVSWTAGPWASATIGANGYIKVKHLFNGSFQAGALTIQGGTTPVATASAGERRAWIEVIGAELTTTPATFTIPRLGKFTVTGDWFYPATFPIPASGVTSMTVTAGRVTVTTVAAHGYTIGSIVEVNGAVETAYNGKYLIETVPTTTTFTYTPTVTPGATASVRGSLIAQLATSGSTQQLIQLPATSTNGTTTAGIAPYGGMYIETYYNSGVYEAYPCVGNMTAAASLVNTDNFRGKVVYHASLGQIRIGGDGTNNWGYVPGGVDVVAASWVTAVSTYTTAVVHNLVVGQPVVVTGFIPTGYNGTYLVVSTPTTTTFTVAQAVQPTGTLAPTNIVSTALGLTTVTVGSTGAVIEVGSYVTVLGSSVPGHNGTFRIQGVIGTAASITGFTYYAFNTTTTAVTAGVTITSIGTATPAGLKIRIPNVISFNSTKAAAGGTFGVYLNVIPSSTLTSRPRFITTSAGVINIDKWCTPWYQIYDQVYSVNMTNVIQCESIRISECATSFNIDNVVTGTSVIASSVQAYCLNLQLNYSGGTINNCVWGQLSLATTLFGNNLWVDTFNVTVTNAKCVVFGITTAGGAANRLNTVGGAIGTYNLTRVSDCTFTNTTLLGAGVYLSTCTNLTFTNTHYANDIRTVTSATAPNSVFNVQSNSGFIKIDGIDFGGQLNCHPYMSLLNICAATLAQTGGSNNIKLRNIGTPTNPLEFGFAMNSGTRFIISQGSITKAATAGAGCYAFELKRIYTQHVDGTGSLAIHNMDNSCSDILFESVDMDPGWAEFVGSATTTTLTVASISAGKLKVGQLVMAKDAPVTGTVLGGTFITAYGTGVGGVGTYTIDTSQTIAASTSMIASRELLPSNLLGTSPLNVLVKGCAGDLGKQPQAATYGYNWGDTFTPSKTAITAITWATGTATYTTLYAHGLTTGDTVDVTGVKPDGYNGSYTVTAVGGPTSTAFTVPITINPGVYNGSGHTNPLNGYINLMMNEQTSKLTTYAFTRLGTGSGFTSTGFLALLNPYDEIIWTQPYYAIGHTGFPTGVNAVLPRVYYGLAAAGNPNNHNFEYDIDKGAGFSGTFKSLQFLGARGETSWGIASTTLTATPLTATVVGSIAGSVLTVTSVSAGYLYPGMIVTGTGITAGTVITDIIDAPACHVGIYTVEIMTFAAGTYTTAASTQTVTSTTITASTSTYGIKPGDYIFDQTVVANIPAGTTVVTVNSSTGITMSGPGTTSSSQVIAFSVLQNETGINAATGFKLKIRARANTLALTNVLTSIAVKTTSTAVAQTYQYPLDTVATTITLQNIVVGSRYRIETIAGLLMFEGTAVATTVTIAYTWNANVNIKIRVRKSSTAPKYQPFETLGTITNTGINAYISQILDAVVG